MIQYLRALSASLLMGCSMWDFSDCRVSEMGECILYGRPRRVDERMQTKGFLVYQMQDHYWNHKINESFGCGDGDSPSMARNEAWRDAHATFEKEFGTKVRCYDGSLLEETLKLSEEKKYVACAEVRKSYELERNGL